MADKIVTANHVRSGRVVYLGLAGWSERIADAVIVESAVAVAGLMETATAAVAACEVVGPAAIDVVRSADGPRPVRLRERIRAGGPTTGHSLGSAVSGPVA